MSPKIAADLHRLPEDERIRLIGESAASGQIVGVMLEKDEPEKIERYVRKIKQRFPTVTLLDRTEFTPSVVTLRFGPKPS